MKKSAPAPADPSADRPAPTQSVLRADINSLKVRLEKVRAAAKQESKTRDRLRAEAVARLELIAAHEASIRGAVARHDSAKHSINSTIAASVAEYERRLGALSERNRELEMDSTCLDLALRERERASAEHAEAHTALAHTQLENAELLATRTEHYFSVTLRFEAVLRELVAALYVGEKQAAAARDLEDEALAARVNNRRLKELRAQNSREGERLSARERELRVRVCGLRVDEGVARTTTELLAHRLRREQARGAAASGSAGASASAESGAAARRPCAVDGAGGLGLARRRQTDRRARGVRRRALRLAGQLCAEAALIAGERSAASMRRLALGEGEGED